MNICYLIPARYESTRLPGKPLLKINNKTIIKRVYEQVLQCKYKGDIYVTTDDDRIISEIGNKNCIKVTEECLNGTERICYALNKLQKIYDIVVNVQGDEPFIDPININFVIDKYLEYQNLNDNLVCVTCHNKMNIEDVLNSNIGKLVLNKYNDIIYCSRSMIPGNKNNNPNINLTYNEHIGIFVFRSSYLKDYFNDENTNAMLSEDIEWLKIIEHGHIIKSFQIPGTFEKGINTNEDYIYLKNKYE
jgi:3-deoxy-manno-octulosonate cytidylyltransferase (CMP-KDO synthetase)